MARLLPLGLVLLTAFSSATAAQDGERSKSTTERLSTAEGEIQALWESYFRVVRDDLPNTKGSVDCGSRRYEEVKPTNSYLVFFVACEGLERRGSDYRASIAIGNPHTFAFARVTGTFSYGKTLAAALVNEQQRIAFSIPGELRPGTWTRFEVRVDAPADAEDLTKIIVEFETGGALSRSDETPARSTSAPQYGLLRRP